MWCWRGMETINTTGRVKNERVLQGIKEERNIRHTITRRKANWISHILSMNCLLKHVIEGKIRGKIEAARRRRSCKQLLMTLRKREGTGNRRRKHWISLTGKLALEEKIDLQLD
jgi:hypothetical protein